MWSFENQISDMTPTELDLVRVHPKNIYCVPANNLKNSEVILKKWQKSTFLRVDERKKNKIWY
jgi:hypothetical protein